MKTKQYILKNIYLSTYNREKVRTTNHSKEIKKGILIKKIIK